MSTTRKEGSLYTRISGNLAVLEFGHPASNSMSSDLLGRIASELDRLGNNPAVSVVLLQSEGDRAFCAGASFDELLQVSTPAQSAAFFSGFATLINTMRQCPKPIVGRAHGKAVGGGVGLIAACDYVLACEAASIRLSELSIGIAPLVIAPAVRRKAGAAGLAELSLAPTEWKSAYWAQEKGLFARVYETQKELKEEAESFAATLARFPPEALSALKAALWEGTEHWDVLLSDRATVTGRLALSDTTQQTLQAFKNKK